MILLSMPLIRTTIAIAQEEMLHLSLAGNLLTALGGSLDLYQDTIVPKYPGHILQDRVEMNLSAADEEQLRFLQRARNIEFIFLSYLFLCGNRSRRQLPHRGYESWTIMKASESFTEI